MPPDVRARIAARLGLTVTPPTPEQVEQATRTQSIHERGATTAGVMAGITAADPALGEAMQRIMAMPLPEPPAPLTRDQVAREMRDAAAAVRICAYRREIVKLGVFLVDQPNDADAGERIGVLTRAVRELEQRFPIAATLAHRELQREKGTY